MAVNTRKKKVFNVDELKAYRVAYGKQLGAQDYITFVGAPALLLGVISFLLLFNFWVSGAMFLIGAFYGLIFILPMSIKKQYQADGFNQRNKFLNNITQVLTDNNQTVLMALQKVTPRSQGEFRSHLQRFHAMLVGADNERIREAVVWFGDIYDDDLIFIQYIEQLETALIEGKTNIDTLKDIKTYHNEISKKQREYEVKKSAHLGDMKKLLIVTLVLIVSLSVSFGFGKYLEAYARHPSGYISAGIYMFLNMMFFKKFSVYLFDDSVMEVKM